MKAMGMKNRSVKQIFLSTGMWIVGLGILVGFTIAIIFYFLQQQFGIVPIPEGFLVDRYPIDMRWFDFVVVTLTVLAIGYIASYFPAKKAALLDEQIRYE